MLSAELNVGFATEAVEVTAEAAPVQFGGVLGGALEFRALPRMAVNVRDAHELVATDAPMPMAKAPASSSERRRALIASICSGVAGWSVAGPLFGRISGMPSRILSGLEFSGAPNTAEF